ncbi:MAG: adenylate/guanylate cyclase domain-containing protein [Jatrophihabitans sp.]
MTATEDRPPTEMTEVVEAGSLDVARLFTRVENVLLGGPRKYTPGQVASLGGAVREETQGLWRALGFPIVGEEDEVYADSDLEALALVGELQSCGFDDPDLVAAMTRLFGQTFSRLASWQGQLLLEMLSERPDLTASEDSIVDVFEHVVPAMERLQSYAWRRQLVAYFARVAERAGEQTLAQQRAGELAIGFVDMSGFTSLTRRASEIELRELLDAFESFATTIVGTHGGRIVKTIGDEVLFQADDAAAAAQIALEMIEAAEADARLPDLRAGLALGPVVSRLGDVYGSTVNIASRLTSLSRPGWVLIDRTMYDALADDPRFRIKARKPESVRGYHHLRPWRLRRADA